MPNKVVILKRAQGKLTDVFKKMDTEISAAAAKLATMDFASPEARGLLRSCSSHPYSVDCVIFDAKGVMQVIEPAGYQRLEGTDLGSDPILVKLRETRKPVFSGVFRAAEGMNAVAAQYPILSPDKKFIGSLSVLIKPEVLLAKVVGPLVEPTIFSCTVLQKDGLSLYDSDPQEIGRNLLTDPAYRDAPELIEAAKKITKDKSGSATYRFPKPGAATVRKEVAWGTAALHGTEWRIVIAAEVSDKPAPKAK